MRFTAIVQAHGKTATGIDVPDAVMTGLDRGKRPLITVTINGHTYTSAIGVMGGKSLIPLSADNRAKAGVSAGDTVEVDVEIDTAPRMVEIPTDLTAALAGHPAAKKAFDELSNSGKKRHVLSVESAKTDETRQRRVAKAIEELGA
jgi:Bacteriocin-protection, YdeI or OmpD-Associated/Domain of unknown function (DUF1905)